MNDNFLTYNEYSSWKNVNDCCTNPYSDICAAQYNFNDELIERVANEVLKEMQKKFGFTGDETGTLINKIEIEKYHLKHK